MKRAILFIVLLTTIGYGQEIIVRERRTDDSTSRTTETSVLLRVREAQVPQRLTCSHDSLQREMSAMRDELRAAKEWQRRYNEEFQWRLDAQGGAIKRAAAHKFGFVGQVSQLISRNPARQNYSLGLSYALSPAIRIEGSVLAGGSYANQTGDLGAKLFGRYRINEWEIGFGGLYRAAGRRNEPHGEDDRYFSLSPIVRYVLGVPYIELGYAYEWHLNWKNEVSDYTQKWNEHRLSIGVGFLFE